MKATKTSYLFPSESKNQPWADQGAVSKAVSMKKAYMPVAPFGPHDLRRTTRTLLAALECPDRVAEAIIGHMVGVYNRHHYDPQRRHWLTVLDQRLEALAAKV
jgi:integrase